MHGIALVKEMSHKTSKEVESMRKILYALAVRTGGRVETFKVRLVAKGYT